MPMHFGLPRRGTVRRHEEGYTFVPATRDDAVGQPEKRDE